MTFTVDIQYTWPASLLFRMCLIEFIFAEKGYWEVFYDEDESYADESYRSSYAERFVTLEAHHQMQITYIRGT